MNEKIQEYIDKKGKEKEQILMTQKRVFLINEGLYDKEYAPNDEDRFAEYPNIEHFTENGYTHHRRYKIIPYEVSDEEYEQIKEAYASVEDIKQSPKNVNKETIDNNKNGIATFMTVVGIII